MNIVILCGGLGTRLDDYSFPKPLNMIYGKPSISFCLQNIPDYIKTLHFVVAPHLIQYNFEEIVKNEFKSKTCVFHYLPYFTRGPAESAFLGTQDLSSEDNVLFLDNDVLYNFPENIFENKMNAFLGYAVDNTASEEYSFLKVDEDQNVTDFKEKMRISNFFCCGVYGFKSLDQFRSLALSVLNSSTEKELYMSLLFQKMLKDNTPVKGIFFEGNIYHIGSLNELKKSWNVIKRPKMRICFDLDNTLVTYPSVPNDYSTVKPIETMISLAQKMRNEGHTIIIHTARRMKTHLHNVGAVLKDIGKITFDTLDKFNIPYDEIIFGKPIADMYIDDRSINPYRNDMFSLGYIYETEKEIPINSLKPNRYNTLQVEKDVVLKSGPLKFLEGEIFYYEHIPTDSYISQYFPKYYGKTIGETIGTIKLEHIKGIPFFTLYTSNLITTGHIDQLFNFLDLLHNLEGIKPPLASVKNNYVKKLQERFLIKEDYPYADAEEIQQLCMNELTNYLDNIVLRPYIHGDFWFSNIIVVKDAIKVIDMKGRLYDTFSTGGDIMYDYGKCYQSVLGYDCILNDMPLPENNLIIRLYFEKEIEKRKISLSHLKIVTFALVMGTFHCNEENAKKRIWNWIKEIFTYTQTPHHKSY